jgi:SAM-dependent methyltransferase
VLRALYDRITWPVHEKWIGTLQAAAVVRSLNLTYSLKRYLAKDDHVMILDAGCGYGATQTLIQARRYPKANFVAVDYNNQRPAKGRLPIPDNITFIESDLFDYKSPNDYYKLIICMDVLEHLKEDHKMINRLSNWIDRQGILILHVPSIIQKTYFKNAQPIRRNDTSPHFGDQHERDGYALDELESTLNQYGFIILDSRNTFSPVTWFFKEIYQILDNYGVPGIGIMSLPFIYLFATIDYYYRPKRGNGILIIAKKLTYGQSI